MTMQTQRDAFTTVRFCQTALYWIWRRNSLTPASETLLARFLFLDHPFTFRSSMPMQPAVRTVAVLALCWASLRRSRTFRCSRCLATLSRV